MDVKLAYMGILRHCPTYKYRLRHFPLRHIEYVPYTPLLTAVALISSIDSAAMPKGTALLYTVRSLGSTLGVSLGGSIQVGALVHGLKKRFRGTPNSRAIIDAIVHSKAAIKTLPPDQQAKALKAYAYSLRAVWIAAGCVAVCTLLTSVFIKQNEIRRKPAETTEEE